MLNGQPRPGADGVPGRSVGDLLLRTLPGRALVVGAIVTPAMRAESPDRDFATFTPAEEIAEAIGYLCSDAAASMNGQRLTLRGAF